MSPIANNVLLQWLQDDSNNDHQVPDSLQVMYKVFEPVAPDPTEVVQDVTGTSASSPSVTTRPTDPPITYCTVYPSTLRGLESPRSTTTVGISQQVKPPEASSLLSSSLWISLKLQRMSRCTLGKGSSEKLGTILKPGIL